MRVNPKLPYFLPFLLLFLVACASQRGERTYYYGAETHKPYDDVLAELKVAIADHNFRITNHSRVGYVIRKRGYSDFPDYDTLQFCSLSHARELLQISPGAIRHMPCTVVVYAREGATMVQTRLLPTDTADPALNDYSQRINAILREIVDFAVEQ